MCEHVTIPENLRPLYLPAPFRSPPMKGMVLHCDEEGRESICYPEDVWNLVPDPEKAFMRSERNKEKRLYRAALKKYKQAVEVAIKNNENFPPPPRPPAKRSLESDKSIPR